jgi:peptidoglycan/xylan/chitin deacetylase (PgdA/CDA1 family)
MKPEPQSKPFSDEAAYRQHVAASEAADARILSFLQAEGRLSVSDALGEWWEAERNPGRLYANYSGPGREDDGQVVTALAILWSDDPYGEHVREVAAYEEECRLIRENYEAGQRRGVIVWADEESERRALSRLLTKYPDAGKQWVREHQEVRE